MVPGSMSFSSTGNLGTFVSQPIVNPMFANWTDQFGNHIQLDFADNEPFNSFPTLGSVGPGEAAFFFLDGNPQFNDSVSVEPVVTPEPVAGICLIAALPLLLLRRKRLSTRG